MRKTPRIILGHAHSGAQNCPAPAPKLDAAASLARSVAFVSMAASMSASLASPQPQVDPGFHGARSVIYFTLASRRAAIKAYSA
jgi:hypothetical protein